MNKHWWPVTFHKLSNCLPTAESPEGDIVFGHSLTVCLFVCYLHWFLTSILKQITVDIAVWHKDASYQDLASDCSTSMTYIWHGYNILSVIEIGFLVIPEPDQLGSFCLHNDRSYHDFACWPPWPIFDLDYNLFSVIVMGFQTRIPEPNEP